MDFEELTKKIEELKAQGMEDEDILNIFYEAFAKQEMGPEDLAKAAGAMGYEFSEEFKAELEKEEPGEEPEQPEGLTKEEFEDTQEIDKPDESEEEFKEKIDEINGDEGKSEEDEPEEDEEDEEDNEDEVLKKYFKV